MRGGEVGVGDFSLAAAPTFNSLVDTSVGITRRVRVGEEELGVSFVLVVAIVTGLLIVGE